MSLRIFNTLTREIETFIPIEPNHVKMYVCGMTIYDFCHIGHARMMMAFDVVQRWLRATGWQVTYVRNITDIDDKIIRRALERGLTIRDLTDEMISAMRADTLALGIESPTYEPRATEFVPEMLSLIAELESKGLAYRSDDGDVNFAVRKFDGYGKLSGKSVDELRSGARVAVAGDKKDPLDFVLWKAAKTEEPDQAKWESDFGQGRPGWHIECSAMSCAHLGQTFDIHGGGADLQFPHHENEIAQSEGASGKTLAHYWMHNGFVKVDNEKMSKSLGNFFTIRDVLKSFDAETVRFFLLRAHYRSALNYSDMHLSDAHQALRRLYTTLRAVPPNEVTFNWADSYAARFFAAMNEDFSTPEAIAVLFDLSTEVNKTKSSELSGLMKSLAGCIGLLQMSPQKFLQNGAAVDASLVQSLIDDRLNAKLSKNYKEADRLRDQLLSMGVALKDNADGTTWESI